MTKLTNPLKSAIYNRTERFSRMRRQNAPMFPRLPTTLLSSHAAASEGDEHIPLTYLLAFLLTYIHTYVRTYTYSIDEVNVTLDYKRTNLHAIVRGSIII
jgi:hypothetical protein